MTDVIYDLLEHCKRDLGAKTASIVFGNKNLRIKPAMCIFMAQYNLCITFLLRDILDIIELNDYEHATEIFDNEIEKIIIMYRRKKTGDE